MFYDSNTRAFYFHIGHALKRQQISPRNHSNRLQPHDKFNLKFTDIVSDFPEILTG